MNDERLSADRDVSIRNFKSVRRSYAFRFQVLDLARPRTGGTIRIEQVTALRSCVGARAPSMNVSAAVVRSARETR